MKALLPAGWLADEDAVPRAARAIGILAGLIYIGVGLAFAPFDFESVAMVIGPGIALAVILRFVLVMVLGWYFDLVDRHRR